MFFIFCVQNRWVFCCCCWVEWVGGGGGGGLFSFLFPFLLIHHRCRRNKTNGEVNTVGHRVIYYPRLQWMKRRFLWCTAGFWGTASSTPACPLILRQTLVWRTSTQLPVASVLSLAVGTVIGELRLQKFSRCNYARMYSMYSLQRQCCFSPQLRVSTEVVAVAKLISFAVGRGTFPLRSLFVLSSAKRLADLHLKATRVSPSLFFLQLQMLLWPSEERTHARS